MVKVNTLKYDGNSYFIAEVPDVITGSELRLLIGSHSLNIALYDEEKGYHDRTAESIDEQIYAYLEDDCFLLEDDDFLSKVQMLLD